MNADTNPQAIADTILAAGIVAAQQREDEAAENLMRQFTADRTAEMARLAEQVIKPHMRGWAKDWFKSKGLPLPPGLDDEKPTVFAG